MLTHGANAYRILARFRVARTAMEVVETRRNGSLGNALKTQRLLPSFEAVAAAQRLTVHDRRASKT